MKSLLKRLLLSLMLFSVCGEAIAQEETEEIENEISPDEPTFVLRPWCKVITQTTIHRTSTELKRSQISYEWDGLRATVSGAKIGVVEYNQWGEVTYQLLRPQGTSEDRAVEKRFNWDCSQGWCRDARFTWTGLEGTRGSSHQTYNQLGYLTRDRFNQAPEFSQTSITYECEGRYCKLLERFEEESCNQCGGRRGRKVTKYIWSGRQAVIHEYRWREGPINYLEREGRGSIMISETGQTLSRQISYISGESYHERFEYHCDL